MSTTRNPSSACMRLAGYGWPDGLRDCLRDCLRNGRLRQHAFERVWQTVLRRIGEEAEEDVVPRCEVQVDPVRLTRTDADDTTRTGERRRAGVRARRREEEG